MQNSATKAFYFLPLCMTPTGIVRAQRPGRPAGTCKTASTAADSFFTKVRYVGALAPSNLSSSWLASWTNFAPQHTDY
jgi:hypothetical protein